MGAAAVRALLLLGLAGCNALEDLEDCEQDADCALGERCHPTEKFCTEDTGPIQIGASLSLTGELGEFGKDVARGLELAAGIVNDNGGILGRSLVIDVLDDETRVETAIANVEQLIGDRVVGIVGPLTSSQALETQSLTFEAQVVQISPTAGTPELSDAQPARERFFFRTISTVRSGSAAAIALFARAGPAGGTPCGTMAILHTDDAIGNAYLEAVEELFGKQGGCIVARISFPETEIVDYDAQVTALVDAAPDCALLVAFPEAAVQITGETKQRTQDQPSWDDFFWIGTTTLHGTAFLEASALHPLDPGEGLFIGDEDSTPATLEYAELRRAFNEQFERPLEEDLPVFVSNTYDAAMLVALAVQEARTTADRLLIRDGIWNVSSVEPGHTAFGPIDWAESRTALERGEAIHYKGASSSLVFDERGTVSNPCEIFRIEGGAFSPVRTYEESEIDELLTAPDQPAGDCP